MSTSRPPPQFVPDVGAGDGQLGLRGLQVGMYVIWYLVLGFAFQAKSSDDSVITSLKPVPLQIAGLARWWRMLS